MDDLLKGNFQVKDPVKNILDQDSSKESLSETRKKRALSCIGGSMVYIDQTELLWDGEDKTRDNLTK